MNMRTRAASKMKSSLCKICHTPLERTKGNRWACNFSRCSAYRREVDPTTGLQLKGWLEVVLAAPQREFHVSRIRRLKCIFGSHEFDITRSSMLVLSTCKRCPALRTRIPKICPIHKIETTEKLPFLSGLIPRQLLKFDHRKIRWICSECKGAVPAKVKIT
jgi:hypothetical protein